MNFSVQVSKQTKRITLFLALPLKGTTNIVTHRSVLLLSLSYSSARFRRHFVSKFSDGYKVLFIALYACEENVVLWIERIYAYFCVSVCVWMWHWYWYTHICNLLFSYFLAFLMLWEFQDLKRHKQHKLGESSTNTNTQHKHGRVLVNMHAYQDDFWPSVWPSYIYLHIQTDRQNIVYVHIYTYERTFR